MQRARSGIANRAHFCGRAVERLWFGSLSNRHRRIQRADQFETRFEETRADGFGGRAIGTRRILAEVLEISAIVEDVEELLVHAGCEEIFS